MAFNLKTSFLLVSIYIIALTNQSCTTTHLYHTSYQKAKTNKINKTDYITYNFKSNDLDSSFTYTYNDSVKLTYILHKYSLNGDTIVAIRVENLLSNPIYINLLQSSFIKNGHSNSYNKYVKTQPTTFIPPKSYYTIEVNPELDSKKNADKIFNSLKNQNLYDTIFTASNSPFVYRNLITFSSNKDLKNSTLIENKFWIEKISITQEKRTEDYKDNIGETYRLHNYTEEETYYVKAYSLSDTKKKFAPFKTLYGIVYHSIHVAFMGTLYFVELGSLSPGELWVDRYYYDGKKQKY